MSNQTTERSLAELQRKVLGHEGLGGYTEIRTKAQWSKPIYVQDDRSFAEKVLRAKDIYVGINPRNTCNGTGLKGGICANDVSHVSCLVIDIDPVRPKDTASSDEQHQQSCEIGKRIVNDCPGSIAVSSGSGCHVYFPIEPVKVLNVEGITQSIKRWTMDMKSKYETKDQKIDHIFDLPRVIRVWGSFNTKSQRPCEPITDVTRDGITVYRFNVPLQQVYALLPQDTAKVQTSETETRFDRLVLTSPGLRAIVEGKAVFESRSEANYAFITNLAQAHFTADEIRSLMHRNPLGKDRADDVNRILDKLRANQVLESYSLVHHGAKYQQGLKNRKMGLKTGMRVFDEMVSGFKNQKVYLTAARPTNGKTTIMTQWLDHLVSVEGQVALCFPTEVGAEPIIDKIVCKRSGVNLKKFQNGDFNDVDTEKIAKAVESVKGLPLVVVEDFGLTTEKIEKKMREVAPTVVAIDYINAMKFPNGGEPNEMAASVRKIKELAGDYNVPILLFAQLRRGDGKLDLSALKGTGSLEELCDVVSFLYSIGDRFDYPTKSVLEVMKSKYSATGPINLDFYRSTCEFKENNNG